MLDLQAELIQAAVFVAPQIRQEDAETIWKRILPESAEPETIQRANASTPALLSSATGVFGVRSLRVTSQVGRIDLHLSASQSEARDAVLSAQIARMPDVSVLLEELEALVCKILNNVEPVRLAIVLDLGVTVPDNDELKTLKEELSGLPFPEGSTDILLQFNKRKRFDCSPDVWMNRLCTWSAGQAMLFTALSGIPVFQQNQFRKVSFVNLKIDVNSAADQHIVPGSASDAWREIAAVVRGIASQGLKAMQ